MDPTLVFGCITQQVLGEHGNVSDFLGGGSEDALLEVHFHVQVLAHLGGFVVALGGVYTEADTAHEAEGLVLAAHGFVETVREDGEVVNKGEKPGSPCACVVGEATSFSPFSIGLGVGPGEPSPRDPVACSRTRP